MSWIRIAAIVLVGVAVYQLALKPGPTVSAADLSPGDDVVMFATEWCGYCEQARRYFAANGIDYREFDIERSTEANATFERIGGRGVPLVVIGRERIHGFSAPAYDQAIERLR